MIDPFTAFSLLALTIILGYLGNWFFGKTRVPDVIWLLAFGLLIGQVLGMVDPELFVSLLPFVVPLALIIILFDAGLHMELYTVLHTLPRSLTLSLVGIVLTMLSIAALLNLLLDFDPAMGLLMGAIVGGTSSTVVLRMAKGLYLKERVKNILELDSVTITPLCIVLAIALIRILTMPELMLDVAIREVMSKFSIAIIFGGIIGICWMFVLDCLRGRPFDYMLTLAIVFLLYVFNEGVGGDGSLACLVFGLVLANATTFSRILKLKKVLVVGREAMKRFHEEITFLIRSFLFVSIGIILTLELSYILYGLLMLVALYGVRLLSVKIATLKLELTQKEFRTLAAMIPRGEGAAVLASLPLIHGLPRPDVFLNLAFVLIFLSVIYTTISIWYIHRKPKKESGRPEP